MNTITQNTISYVKNRPMLIGVLSVLGVIAVGACLAFSVGFTTPHFAKADGPDDASSFSGIDASTDSGSVDISGADPLGGSFVDAGTSVIDSGTIAASGAAVSTGADVAPVTAASTDSASSDATPAPSTDSASADTYTIPNQIQPTDQQSTDSGSAAVIPSVSTDSGSTDVDAVPDATLPPCSDAGCAATPSTDSGSTDATPAASTDSGSTDTSAVASTDSGSTDVDAVPDATLPPCSDAGCAATPSTDSGSTDTTDVTPSVSSVTPPVECAIGDTGTYPNCIPPVTPPSCATGDTGTYPNCVPPTPPPSSVPACLSLSANATTITAGQSVTLSWATQNATSISIDNGVGSFTTVPSGSTTVTPSTTTTYNATVPGAAIFADCSVTVTVQPVTPACTSNCGGGGGGGGGGSSGGTIYGGGGGGISGGSISYGGTSGQILAAPVAGEVYLSQIPYTGLDLGTWGTILYWTLLVLWCVAAAYLIIFTLIPFIYKHMRIFGVNVRDMLNTPTGTLAVASHGAAVAHGADAHGSVADVLAHGSAITETAPVAAASGYAAYVAAQSTHAAPATSNPSAYTAVQGFKSFAKSDTLTIDDIVKGLSRIPAETATVGALSGAVATAHSEHASHDDAVSPEHEVIPVSVPHTNYSAVQSHSYEATPRTEAPAAAVSTDVRDFIAALLNGDRDTVFGTLRQVVREGGDAEMFITQVVCALDDAYRARVDGTKVNAEIAAMTGNAATPFLERLTGALTNAVDSSYSPGITGSKLALTRALAVVEG